MGDGAAPKQVEDEKNMQGDPTNQFITKGKKKRHRLGMDVQLLWLRIHWEEAQAYYAHC